VGVGAIQITLQVRVLVAISFAPVVDVDGDGRRYILVIGADGIPWWENRETKPRMSPELNTRGVQ